MSVRFTLLFVGAVTLSAPQALLARQTLSSTESNTPGRLAELRPSVCTGYLIDHIGFNGRWLMLDDGSIWAVDHEESWRLAFYIEGQRAYILRRGDWKSPLFELFFGSQGKGIPVEFHGAPDKEAFRYREVEAWNQDHTKLKLSDGSIWSADVEGEEAAAFAELDVGAPVLLTARTRWWTSHTAVALLDARTAYSYAVRPALEDQDDLFPERQSEPEPVAHSAEDQGQNQD